MGDLSRFVGAQEDGGAYERALGELREGRKRSHWMWFVFPQIAGLGQSAMSRAYAIGSLQEAADYLADPVLGARLRECAAALLARPGDDAASILGEVDALKLRSSMTLFAAVGEPGSFCREVLERYFDGERDPLTLALI